MFQIDDPADFYAEQERFNRLFPLLSNVQFGNEIFANLGGGSARFSGNMPFINNYQIGINEPIPFDFNSIFGGFQMLNEPLDGQTGISPELPAAAVDGETRIGYFLKNFGAAALALVLIFLGGWFILQPIVTSKTKQVAEVLK